MQYYRLLNDNLWGVGWYEAALLLIGLGFGGLFPAAWLNATLSTALAPCLVVGVQTCVEIFRDPTCCNLWPIGLVMWLFLGLPAPLVGGALGHLINRTWAPRLLYLISLVGGLGLGASLPLIRQNEYRRLETEEIPAILRRLYEAETSYSVKRADKGFACDGWQLPEAGKLGWKYRADFMVVQDYTIRLDCPDEASPHSFRITAFSRELTRTRPSYLIDQTGRLVETSNSGNQVSK